MDVARQQQVDRLVCLLESSAIKQRYQATQASTYAPAIESLLTSMQVVELTCGSYVCKSMNVNAYIPQPTKLSAPAKRRLESLVVFPGEKFSCAHGRNS